MTHLLIDYDIIAYEAASKADNAFYECPDGFFTPVKKEADNYCKINDLKIEDITKRFEPDPVEYALHNANNIVKCILERYDSATYTGYLTGAGNFRERVATILPYKGNRVGLRKPFHLEAVRNHLCEFWNGKVVIGVEADDAIGIEAKGDTVVCSLDKDLKMIPGRNYNWRTDKELLISEVEALRNFYKQVLTGDDSDNILGLYGCGPASTLLKKIDTMYLKEDMDTFVLEEYRKRFGAYAERFFEETKTLLWILREPLT